MANENIESQIKVLESKLKTIPSDFDGKYPKHYYSIRGKIAKLKKLLPKTINNSWNEYLAK